MARAIKLTSGSIFNGNPITFTIQPNIIIGEDDDKNPVYPSFHRVIVEVVCGISGGSYETIQMSQPVTEETDTTKVDIDISSALRTLRDAYTYTAEAVTYPFVSYRIRAYDEYMLNGEVKQTGYVYFPGEDTYYRSIFGGFSDFERITSAQTKGVTALSRKPSSSPHLAFVGESFAYTPPYSTSQEIADSGSLEAPTSKIVTVSKEGAQTLGYQSIYALSSSEAANRQVFRFINSFGVLESISVPRAYSKSMSVTTTAYAVTRQETFNSFSRSAVKKQSNIETWTFQTDPLNEDWLHWYLHEFLMSEHIWMQIKNVWVPCTITVDDDIEFLDRTSGSMYSITFAAALDITGSPLL